jgi:hypothetical protein
MDQSRKSSDREQAALRQAQEALELEKTAVADASRAAKRENYMLDLTTDASQDMAGMLRFYPPFSLIFFVFLLTLCCFLQSLYSGSFLDAAVEEQRVNS